MMRTGRFLTAFLAMLFGMATLAPMAEAKDLGDGFSLFGDVRYRAEQDTDSTKDKNRTRERARLRMGAKYKANDNVTTGIRLATGASSLQSPHFNLGVADTSKNEDFGLDQAYIQLSGGPAVALLGKWGSPLFNPMEFVHDGDINFEGLGFGVSGDVGVKLTGLVARTMITERNWVGMDDDSLLTFQLIASGGDSVTWKAAAGGNLFTMKSMDPKPSHNVYHAVAEINAKELSGLTVGGGYNSYSGDADVESQDKSAFAVWGKANAGPVGIGLGYWDVGYAAMPLFGAAGNDNWPYTTNFTGWSAQLNLPKLFEAVSWDLTYYSQKTKRGTLSFAKDANGNSTTPGYVLTGDGRTVSRIQINFNTSF